MPKKECKKVVFVGQTGIKYLCPYTKGHEGPCQDPRDPNELLKFKPSERWTKPTEGSN